MNHSHSWLTGLNLSWVSVVVLVSSHSQKIRFSGYESTNVILNMCGLVFMTGLCPERRNCGGTAAAAACKDYMTI